MWIKASEQLPTEGQSVIYYFEYVGVHRGKFTQSEYDPEHFGTDDNGDPYKANTFYGERGFLTDDVTHWMPDEGQELPEKPSE